jgi:hypothetical protein
MGAAAPPKNSGQSGSSLVSSYLVWDLIKTLVFQAFLRGQVVTDIRFNAKKSPKNQKMALDNDGFATLALPPKIADATASNSFFSNHQQSVCCGVFPRV